MNYKKNILAVLTIILFSGEHCLFAKENIGASIAHKVDKLLSQPSDNDRRVIALTVIGAGAVVAGLYLTIIGGHKAASGKQTNENDNESMIQTFVSDGIARLSGFGTALIGIACTAGGSAAIVLAKELIMHLQRLVENNKQA
jgi:hypothetical protein